MPLEPVPFDSTVLPERLLIWERFSSAGRTDFDIYGVGFGDVLPVEIGGDRWLSVASLKVAPDRNSCGS